MRYTCYVVRYGAIFMFVVEYGAIFMLSSWI